VASLLDQAQASLRDICAATIFVKNGEDADVFREVTSGLGLEPFPAVCVVADVCREELLFEIDAEAVVPRR
jgi:enamine deaminase RidA (YjgF/YER057c/UK114 family)